MGHGEGESAGLRSLADSVPISLCIRMLLCLISDVMVGVSVLNVLIFRRNIILLRLGDEFVLIAGLGFDLEPGWPVQLHLLTKGLLRGNLVVYAAILYKRSFFGGIEILSFVIDRVPLLYNLVMLHVRTIDSFISVVVLLIIATDKFIVS